MLVTLISGIVMGALAYSRSGLGTVPYPGYYALSIAARVLFVIAHISFAVTMTILTKNAITGVIFGLVIPNIPQIVEMALRFLKLNVELDFLKICKYAVCLCGVKGFISLFPVFRCVERLSCCIYCRWLWAFEASGYQVITI